LSTEFDLKPWLDRHLVSVLGSELTLHAVACCQSPRRSHPDSVLVWVLANAAANWAPAVRRLLEQCGFSFDFMREAQLIPIPGSRALVAFGSDGAPFVCKSGMVTTRLFRKGTDQPDLLLEVGHQFPSAEAAIQATREFFRQFDDASPDQVLQMFSPVFGAA
jgi:hypothetical protein